MSFRKDYIDYLDTVDYSNPDFGIGIDFTEKTSDEIETLFSNVLKKGMHGLCFSLYEDGQKPGDIIS